MLSGNNLFTTPKHRSNHQLPEACEDLKPKHFGAIINKKIIVQQVVITHDISVTNIFHHI